MYDRTGLMNKEDTETRSRIANYPFCPSDPYLERLQAGGRRLVILEQDRDHRTAMAKLWPDSSILSYWDEVACVSDPVGRRNVSRSRTYVAYSFVG